MKTTTSLFLLAIVVLLHSCTTAYRTGQTPDDVYFSPSRPDDEYLVVQRHETRRYRLASEDYEDRYLRMRVRDRNRWDELNDWYTYERSTLGFNSYFTPALNPYVSWNHYYNPYYIKNPYLYGTSFGNTAATKPVYTKPRVFNLDSYQQMPVNLKNTRATAGDYSVGPFLNTVSKSVISSPNRGNSLRETFGITSSPSSSAAPSSNNSSSSAGTAPVRRF